jgi:hypothetical protein
MAVREFPISRLYGQMTTAWVLGRHRLPALAHIG